MQPADAGRNYEIDRILYPGLPRRGVTLGGFIMPLKSQIKQAKSLVKTSWYVHCMKKPIQEKTILLESKKGADLGGNILRIAEELTGGEYKEYQVFLAVEKQNMQAVEQLLKECKVHGIRLVEYYGTEYFKLLATAKYLINDTAFPRRFVKRDGQIYMNTWHGTSFKKLGKDIPSGAYAMGNIQRNLLMTDYLVSQSPYALDRLSQAHNIENLYQGTYVCAGYPRNQVFFHPESRQKTKDELGLTDKRIYCYMPTWRGVVTEKYTASDKESQALEIRRYLDELDGKLRENEVLFVRLHPFVGQRISCDSYRHIKAFPKGYEPYEILNLADCLVTDYSSVFFDYANRKGGKIILFLYDRDAFQGERDYYCKPEDFPFPVTAHTEELLAQLRSPKEYDDREFLKNYCPHEGPDAAKKLCAFLLKGQIPEGLVTRKSPGNGKKNLLFYVGGLQRNGLTTSFLNLMDNINSDAYNYYAAFQEEYLEKEPDRLEILPSFVQTVPMSKGWDMTFFEALAGALFYKKNVDNSFTERYLKRFYRREYLRNFGFGTYEWAIHFNGYERKVIGLFGEATGKKGIFVHNDMIMEATTKGNQHLPTLRHAYREYDLVAAVTQDIYDRTLEISHKKENLHVVNNCHAYKGVLERAETDFAFDQTTRCTVSESELRAFLKKPARKFISIGRFSPEKGHDLLVEAFAAFHKESPDSVLIIIGGGGELYEKTKEHVDNLGLGDSAVLLQSVQNPMPILKACDLFILSSRYEGLGLVILEADTLGLPVIATDVVGPRGFMNAHGGYLVPPTAEGILSGMKAWEKGDVPVMNVDYEEYNKIAVKEFTELL